MENKRIYTFLKSILASGNDTDNLRENGTTGKDAPFKNLLVNNGSGLADIRVYFNGQSYGTKVNAGTMFQFEHEYITSVRFENLDGTNTAEFEYTIDNKLTQLELLKGLMLGHLEAR
jgi:hypothetical protein